MAFCSHGQYEIDRYDIDSLQLFSENQLTYEFNIESPNQGLFFNKNIYSEFPYIKLKILNNTNDTIIKKYKENDDHLTWIRQGGSCGRCDTMLPNDYFILRSGWLVTRSTVVSVDSRITIQYKIGDNWLNCIIQTWGELYPDGYVLDESAPIKVESDSIEKIQSDIKVQDTTGAFYYYTQNKREYIEPIDSFGTYKYHIYLKDLSEIGLDPKLLKSYLKSKDLKVSIREPRESLITWEENDFLILYCMSRDIERIKTLLKGTAIHFMIDFRYHKSRIYLDDTYDIFFSSHLNWSETDVEEFLKTEGIENYKRLRKTNNEFPLEYSFYVEITLDNKYQHSGQHLINKLIKMPEIAWINTGMSSYGVED